MGEHANMDLARKAHKEWVLAEPRLRLAKEIAVISRKLMPPQNGRYDGPYHPGQYYPLVIRSIDTDPGRKNFEIARRLSQVRFDPAVSELDTERKLLHIEEGSFGRIQWNLLPMPDPLIEVSPLARFGIHAPRVKSSGFWRPDEVSETNLYGIEGAPVLYQSPEYNDILKVATIVDPDIQARVEEGIHDA